MASASTPLDYVLPRNDDVRIPDVFEIAASGWAAFYDLMRVPLPHAIPVNASLKRRAAPQTYGRPMPFNVVPAREGLLLTKSDRELREFLEQARSVSVFFALDALFPGLNPIIASVLHARVDAAMTGNDKEKTFEQLGKLDVRRCYGVPYLGLLELHYAEKKQFLGIKRRVELIFVTQSGNDYSCVIEGQANLKLLLETMLLYRWEAEIKASVAKAIEEVVRPAMGPFIEKLKALGDDGAAKLTEQERTALFEECQRTWQGYCKSKGVTPTALFEAGMQRLEPRISKYREIDASGFDFEVDQLKTQFESEQFAYA